MNLPIHSFSQGGTATNTVAEPRAHETRVARWKRILVPLDSPQGSMRTLSLASELAESLGASLCLIHVLGVPSFFSGLRNVPPLVGKQVLVDEARAYWLAATRRVLHGAVPEQLSIRFGEADREILAAVARFEVDCIVLHAEVQPGLEGLLRDGIMRRVIEGAPCPVLLIPNQVLWPSEQSGPRVGPGDWRSMVVPIERNRTGEQVLHQCSAVAQRFQARVTALSVNPTGRLRSPGRLGDARSQPSGGTHGSFSAWVCRRAPFVTPVERDPGAGKAAPTFLQAARQLQAQLIVMGTRQLSSWRRSTAGGALSRLLAEGPCPILILPPPPLAAPPSARD